MKPIERPSLQYPYRPNCWRVEANNHHFYVKFYWNYQVSRLLMQVFSMYVRVTFEWPRFKGTGHVNWSDLLESILIYQIKISMENKRFESYACTWAVQTSTYARKCLTSRPLPWMFSWSGGGGAELSIVKFVSCIWCLNSVVIKEGF